MKCSKIILIPLLLLLCATAKAQAPVLNDSQAISKSAGYIYYDPLHPEYCGNLYASNSFTEELPLGSGRFLFKFRFYGSNNSQYYTLHVRTSNLGSRSFDFNEGTYEIELIDPGTVRLSLLYATESANCSWEIYRGIYVIIS